MNKTEYTGRLATLKVEEVAAKKKYLVSYPTQPARYDLIVDDGRKLHRVQVKYASQDPRSKGSAVAKLEGHGKTYTSKEIDVLAVYIASTDVVCWFGPEHFVGKSRIFVRTDPAKNNQSKGCLRQEDFVW
jgi:hypothetical protein